MKIKTDNETIEFIKTHIGTSEGELYSFYELEKEEKLTELTLGNEYKVLFAFPDVVFEHLVKLVKEKKIVMCMDKGFGSLTCNFLDGFHIPNRVKINKNGKWITDKKSDMVNFVFYTYEHFKDNPHLRKDKINLDKY